MQQCELMRVLCPDSGNLGIAVVYPGHELRLTVDLVLRARLPL